MGAPHILQNKIPWLIFLVAFGYLTTLSSKTYTWVFVSEDAADWLAASSWWMVPQPFGSPLYILPGRLLSLFPGDLVIKMTVLLSCLPAAITIAIVYLTIKRFTGTWVAVASSLSLLASAVFLSQSTILEEYALSVMFLTLAYYFYTQGKKKLCWLNLGLAAAIHVLIVLIILIWLLVDMGKWKENLRTSPIFVVSGILPYSLILILMASDTPRFCAGGLEWESIKNYLFATAGNVAGNLSIFELPTRLGEFFLIMSMSLGLTWYALYKGIKTPPPIDRKLALAAIGVCLWFWITSLFETAWVHIIYATPFIAILVGVGLSKLSGAHTKIIIGSSIVLILLNGIFLNADLLTRNKPIASTLYNEMMDLPEGSILIGSPRYSFTAVYALSQGKDIIPLISGYTDHEMKFDAYLDYLHKEWGLEGEGTLILAKSGKEQGRRIFYAGMDKDAFNRRLAKCFVLRGDGLVREVVGYTDVPYPPLRLDISELQE